MSSFVQGSYSLFDIRGTSSDFHLRILKRLQSSPDANCEGNISVLRQNLGNWYEVKEVSIDKTEIYPERDRLSIAMALGIYTVFTRIMCKVKNITKPNRKKESVNSIIYFLNMKQHTCF